MTASPTSEFPPGSNALYKLTQNTLRIFWTVLENKNKKLSLLCSVLQIAGRLTRPAPSRLYLVKTVKKNLTKYVFILTHGKS